MGLSNDQLVKALSFADDGGCETFELVPAANGRPAVTVDLYPVCPGDYVRFCVRRIAGERARFLADNRRSIEQGRLEARGLSTEKTDDEVDAEIADGLMQHVERQIDSGPESQAAFVACAMRRPGDERLEALLMRTRRLPGAYAVADRITHANPDEDFSEGVSEWIWGTRTPKSSEPNETAGSTDGTTTSQETETQTAA